MDTTSLEQTLKAQYFLAGLDDAQRQQLLANAGHNTLSTNEHLFQQGDQASHFYVVLKGRIKLYRLSAEGDERIMGMASHEQSFAEGILFMDEPRYPVNALALEPTTVIGLERQHFRAILTESPSTCMAVMSRLTRRIQGLLNEVESLALQNGRERLIHFLLGLVDDDSHGQTSIRLPVRKSEIAARLSIQPETLSRLFRWLDKEELIHSNRDRIDIPDLDTLRASVQV